jgi:hypothetical protein
LTTAAGWLVVVILLTIVVVIGVTAVAEVVLYSGGTKVEIEVVVVSSGSL